MQILKQPTKRQRSGDDRITKGGFDVDVRIAIGAAAGLLLLTAAALATPNDLATFKQLYAPKDGTALAKAGCLTCHAKMPPGKDMNPYGADLAKQGKTRAVAAFKAIENLDSDKDGFTNIQEIQAGTLPGDPASKPAK